MVIAEEVYREAAQGVVSKIVTSLFKNLGRAAKTGVAEVQAALRRGALDYAERALVDVAYVKTFGQPGEPRFIHDFYVCPYIRGEAGLITSPSSVTVSDVSSHTCIVADAGMGKTLFLRFLAMDVVEGAVAVPVYLEARRFRGLDPHAERLSRLMQRCMASFGFELSDEYFHAACRMGHLWLILDGLDEVDAREREWFRGELRDLSRRYPRLRVTFSTRPDPSTESWMGFSVLRLEGLTPDQLRGVVHQMPFGRAVCEQFLHDLDEGRFAAHGAFLANPLLVTVMLLTYESAAEIPQSLARFYGQAFEALYQQHDARKEGYRRPKASGLDMWDFERVFAAFSARTLLERRSSFSRTQLLSYLDDVSLLCGIAFSKEAFADDVEFKVPLLVRDGLELRYAHRAFQEYFAARFVCMSDPTDCESLLRAFDVRADQVVSCAYEMEPSLVEREYLLPALERVARYARNTDPYTAWSRFWGDMSYRPQEDDDAPRGLALVTPSALDVGSEAAEWAVSGFFDPLEGSDLYATLSFVWTVVLRRRDGVSGERLDFSKDAAQKCADVYTLTRTDSVEVQMSIAVIRPDGVTDNPLARAVYDAGGVTGHASFSALLACHRELLSKRSSALGVLDRLRNCRDS